MQEDTSTNPHGLLAVERFRDEQRFVESVSFPLTPMSSVDKALSRGRANDVGDLRECGFQHVMYNGVGPSVLWERTRSYGVPLHDLYAKNQTKLLAGVLAGRPRQGGRLSGIPLQRVGIATYGAQRGVLLRPSSLGGLDLSLYRSAGRTGLASVYVCSTARKHLILQRCVSRVVEFNAGDYGRRQRRRSLLH